MFEQKKKYKKTCAVTVKSTYLQCCRMLYFILLFVIRFNSGEQKAPFITEIGTTNGYIPLSRSKQLTKKRVDFIQLRSTYATTERVKEMEQRKFIEIA